jgi:regulator of PEP synthase PpsR (kinase-PPPase family)
MMGAARTSETSVSFYLTSRRNIPKYSRLHDEDKLLALPKILRLFGLAINLANTKFALCIKTHMVA